MDVAELEQLLQVTDPAALLVPPRVLRRVIKLDRGLAGMGLQVPHRKSHVIERERLLTFAGRAELGVAAGRDLPPVLLLIGRPEPHRLAALPRDQALIKYWQLLFHCRVHVAFAERFPAGARAEAEVRCRVHRLGLAEFAEARQVLRQERYLLPPLDERSAYEEFAACYLELRYFCPNLLPHYFPVIDDFDRVDALLAEDLDAAGLFARTRLPGAPDPVLTEVSGALLSARDPGLADPQPTPCGPASAEWSRRLRERADRARRRGNDVRAALLSRRAEGVCPPDDASGPQVTSTDALDRLVGRLRPALGLDEAGAGEWRQALAAVLDAAGQGLWPAEARLLYDLQKVCVDHERGIFTVSAVGWALSLGRRPLRRPLPNLREVLLLKHLRKAARYVSRVRVTDPQRHQLAALFRAALHGGEERLRGRLRPVLRGVFERVGMRPQNLPERVALNKLTEELLDRAVENGHLDFGDLRDAVSRNNLKLDDLSGPAELVQGDPLLRLDRALAAELDGVYHRGEVYLRALQGFSAAAFGTRVGRFLTRYLALPFGGAYVILEGLQHLIILGHKFLTGEHLHLHLAKPLPVGLLGLFFLCLLNVAPFRRALGAGLTAVGRGLRALFFDLPAAVVGLPVVQRVLASRPVAFFDRYLLAPLTFSAVVCLGLLVAGVGPGATLAGSGAVLAAAVVVLNSRLGRDVGEACADWAVRHWQRIRSDILPGLFRLVMDFFKALVEAVERFLYTVDEWLRFKSGEGRLSLVVKAILKPVWSFVTYVVRIYVNLLIEPTVNPIKHFPVVTVAHKIMAPLIFKIFPYLLIPLQPLGLWIAVPFATMTIFFLPGIFGFLVWEFKENWKLYRANRSPVLKPVAIGHHGETMLRLLKPGLHSGTLPKLFARLRRAERRAHNTRRWQRAQRQRETLHHVEEGVRRFVERELVYLLRASKAWGLPGLEVGAIALGSNRIGVELDGGPGAGEGLCLAFEEHAGRLVAGVSRAGWLCRLTPEQGRVLTTALAGLYKLAGVHLVREQVESCFPPPPPPFAVLPEGLAVWPGGCFETRALYAVAEAGDLAPRWAAACGGDGLPTVPACRLYYSLVPIRWESWVEVWEQDQAGKGHAPGVVDGVRLLPAPEPHRSEQLT